MSNWELIFVGGVVLGIAVGYLIRLATEKQAIKPDYRKRMRNG